MLKTILRKKNLIFDLVISDLKRRYLGSFFGFWGSVINPLLLLMIYCFVFSGILKVNFGALSEAPAGIGNFAIYLFCGLLPWISFSEAATRSSTILLDKGALIKRVIFPKEILPFYLTISGFINQLLALLVFLVILIILQFNLGSYGFLIIFIFPLEILFTFGFCLIISCLYVFFRDIGIFLQTVLQIWLFCTPIFYPSSIIPAPFMPFMKLNPTFHLIHIYRKLLLQNSMPAMKSVIYFAGFSISMLLIGIFVFNKINDKIVDYL